MESICEGCILYGRCDGRCGDTDPLYYWEEEQNDAREEWERNCYNDLEEADK